MARRELRQVWEAYARGGGVSGAVLTEEGASARKYVRRPTSSDRRSAGAPGRSAAASPQWPVDVQPAGVQDESHGDAS